MIDIELHGGKHNIEIDQVIINRFFIYLNGNVVDQ